MKKQFFSLHTQGITAIFFCLAAMLSGVARAESTPEMPYFASITADEANVRTGPSVRYPIQWVYRQVNWPVEVTATFEGWRKIKDVNGDAGWIHESLLSRKRYVVIQANGMQEIYRLPVLNAAPVAVAESGVVAKLHQCKSDWCKVEVNNEKGWVKAENLWGLDKKKDMEE